MSRFINIGILVCMISVIQLASANTNVKITAPQTNPEHPKKCWDSAAQIAYSIGSHNAKNSCQRVHCYPDYRMKYTSCGVHSEAQGYTIEQDLSKDYPDCCAKLVRADRKFKRIDEIDASSVKISKFKGRILDKKYDSSKPKEDAEPVISSTTSSPAISTENNDENNDAADIIEEPIENTN